MAQTTEGTFRVARSTNDEHILVDLKNHLPVFVESISERYDPEFQKEIKNIDVGNKIKCRLVSEDNQLSDSHWFFDEIFDIIQTEVHTVQDMSTPDVAHKLVQNMHKTHKPSSFTEIKEDGDIIGFITVYDKERTDNVIRTEKFISLLEEFSLPPFRVYTTKMAESDMYRVSYYMGDLSSDLDSKLSSLVE